MKKNRNLQFFLFSGTLLLLVIIVAVFFDPDVMNAYFFANPQDTFMDYFNSMAAAGFRFSYQGGLNSYPPLCWIIFAIMSRMSGNVVDIIVEEGRKALKLYQFPMMIYMIALLFTILLSFCLIKRLCEFRESEKNWMGFLMIFSVPFLWVIERGNILLVALMLTLFFFTLKDSEKWWVRDLGYICLAFAAALKIYPAIFGFVLVKDRKYKEAVRCAIYGIVIFVIPFCLFTERGLMEIPDFFRNILGFNSAYTDMVVAGEQAGSQSEAFKNVDDAGRIGFAAFIEHFFMWFGMDIGAAVAAAGKCAIVLSAAAFAAAFFAKKSWQTVLLFTCVLIGFQSRSYVYTVVFMVLPCIFFFNQESGGWLSRIYLLLYALIFFPLPLGWTEHIHEERYYIHYRSFNCLQIGGAICAITIITIAYIILQYILEHKRTNIGALKSILRRE